VGAPARYVKRAPLFRVTVQLEYESARAAILR
jgi:hypothetical protein